jgi:hypothetical protein
LKKVRSIIPEITEITKATITTTIIKTNPTKEGITIIIRTENNEWNISNKRRKKTTG